MGHRQMMFFGPNAASPPKKTPGAVDWNVMGSTLGMPHSSNSMPMSRSIQGNEFSWRRRGARHRKH